MALLGLTSCITHPYDPADVALGPGQKDKAVVLLKLPEGLALPQGSRTGPRIMRLTVRTFDEVRFVLTDEDSALFEIHPGLSYLAYNVKPGPYLFVVYSQQLAWAACLHKATLAFDVRPGEIVFLGEFDPTPQSAFMAQEASKNGEQTATYGELYWYYDSVPPPALGFPKGKAEELSAAEQYVRSNLPKVQGPIRAAEYRSAHFIVGKDMWGNPACGLAPK
jgi:hypothetical protein